MSDDGSEENLCYFGTPLEINEDDEQPKRKLPSDFRERVLDEKGRPLRFHGAFTGGFSAGFFNTAGSEDGFIPSTFYSSRKRTTEKDSGYTKRKPEDFMDESDFSDFGIAPRSVRVANKFDSSEFSNAIKQSLGSIGTISASYHDPLKDIIAPKIITISQRLIKRLFRSEDRQCETHPTHPSEVNSFLTSVKKNNYTQLDFTTMQKENTFGLAYKPLTSDLHQKTIDKPSHLSRPSTSFVDSLFPEYKSIGRGIKGSGIGIGIQEEQDDEVYHNDDMSNYDFSIEPVEGLSNEPTNNERKEQSQRRPGSKSAVLSNFKVRSSMPSKSYPLPYLPRDFNPVFKKPKALKSIKIEKPIETPKSNIPPKNVTEWEKPLEKKQSLPSWSGHLSKKFHSVGVDEPMGAVAKSCLHEPKTLSERDLAVKTQNYGCLTRSVIEWRPDNILCKRFNVPNPYPDSSFTGVPSNKNDKTESFQVSNPTFSSFQMIQDAPDSETTISSDQSNILSAAPSSDDKRELEIQQPKSIPSIRKANIFSVLFEKNDNISSENTSADKNDNISSENTSADKVSSSTIEEEKGDQLPSDKLSDKDSKSTPAGVAPRPIDLFKSIFASDEESESSENEDDADNALEEEILSKLGSKQNEDEPETIIADAGTSITERVNRILSSVTNLIDKKSSEENLNCPNVTNNEDSSSDLEFIEVTKKTLMGSSKKSKSKHKKMKKHKKKEKKKRRHKSSNSD